MLIDNELVINDNLWSNLHYNDRIQLLTCFTLINQLKGCHFLFRNIAVLLECTLKDFYLPRIHALIDLLPDVWIDYFVESFALIEYNGISNIKKSKDDLFEIFIYCILHKNNNKVPIEDVSKISNNSIFRNSYHFHTLKKVLEIKKNKNFCNLNVENCF